MKANLLSEVALAFADREGFGTQLSRALASLCTGLRLSRAYLYLDGQNLATMGYTHEWCAEGIAHQWMQDIPYASYVSWQQMLMDEGRIMTPNTAPLPDDLRAVLEYGGIQSLQAYPIWFEQQVVGFAGFDDCLHQREWTNEECDLLKAASVIISTVCEREIMREHFRGGSGASVEDAGRVSIRDPLTGIFNRHYVFDRLVGFDAEYARLGRNFCISLLGIEQFENINDSYGREAGDFILKEFAAIISSSIRPYDISGRYADDEFIIVSVNASALETGYLIDRILSAVRRHVFKYHGTEIHPGFSYGIVDSSEFPPERLAIEKMVELAGQRLHSASEAVPVKAARETPDA